MNDLWQEADATWQEVDVEDHFWDHEDRAWLMVHGDLRNPDWVPNYYLPHDGCLECGSVYVELDAVTLSPPDVLSVEHLSSGAVKACTAAQYIRGVRLICYEGHAREVVPNPWGFAMAVALALVASSALWVAYEKPR